MARTKERKFKDTRNQITQFKFLDKAARTSGGAYLIAVKEQMLQVGYIGHKGVALTIHMLLA